MKKVALFLSLLILSACSNADSEPEAIEEPTVPDTEISANNNLIQSFQEKIASDQEEIKNTDSEHLKNIYKESIKDWKKEIELIEEENKILEETLIYNDDFQVVQGTGVYVQKVDEMLNEKTLISGFNRDVLSELERYKSEISDGAILILAAPFNADSDRFPVISAYYTQESLEKIDFGNEEDHYLIDNADYVRVHDTLSKSLTTSGNFDAVSDLFNYYSGITY